MMMLLRFDLPAKMIGYGLLNHMRDLPNADRYHVDLPEVETKTQKNGE